MITVGYGDITPISANEKLYVIFMTLTCCATFAYIINTVSSLY